MVEIAQHSVANTSQLLTVDSGALAARVGKLSPRWLAQILSGIDIVLGR